jgi:hypothetical protein
MPVRRAALAGVAGILGLCSLTAGGVLVYVRAEVLDQRAFEQRAVAALRDRPVRRAVADRVVEEIVTRADADFVTARPLLVTAVSSVIASDPFRTVLRVAARDAHRLLFAGQRDRVKVELAGLASVIFSAVQSIDPSLARRLPRSLDVQLAELTVGDLAGGVPRVAQTVRDGALWFPLLGAALLAVSLLVAPSRRRAFGWLSAGLVLAAALVMVLAAARPRAGQPIGRLSLEQSDAAIASAWWEFAGDLRSLALYGVVVGILGVALVSWGAPLPVGWRRSVAAALTRPTTPVLRSVRVIVLLGAATGLMAAPPSVRKAVIVTLAIGLAVLALDELVRGLPRTASTADPSSPGGATPSPRAMLILVVVLAALGAGVIAETRTAREIGLGGEPRPHEEGMRRAGCNGSTSLCGRRLNEMVFAGTHNSMSAATEPGWLFTNQRHDVTQQLQDGIRLLLLDPHWGARSDRGVRTDLLAEGTSLNRAAAALGPTGIRTAEALAGDIGLGRFHQHDGIYLCHTLCELGATPLSETLEQLRVFLDTHPRDLVIVSLESSVPGAAIASEFDRAKLVGRIAALQRGRPMPTLGELLDTGKQLVVFGDHDTAGVPWYLDATTWIQGTAIDGESCRRRRGAAESPFLQINHWLDDFPPRPSQSKQIGSYRQMLSRFSACTQRLGPPGAMIAVDYYRQTAVIDLARALNGAA